jgi:hypothetical protein
MARTTMSRTNGERPVHPAPVSRADAVARQSALVGAFAGFVANVLLVLFFAIARPWTTSGGGGFWLGTANDVAVVIQFAALLPVVTALHRRLPPSRVVRLSSLGAATATTAVAVLQVLLLAGVLSFEAEAPGVVAASAVVYLWVLVVAVVGHRTATLPRPLTRFGLMLGPAYPAGLALAGAGLITAGAPGRALLGAGLVFGGAAWLALPVFPLLVARHVLPKEVS